MVSVLRMRMEGNSCRTERIIDVVSILRLAIDRDPGKASGEIARVRVRNGGQIPCWQHEGPSAGIPCVALGIDSRSVRGPAESAAKLHFYTRRVHPRPKCNREERRVQKKSSASVYIYVYYYAFRENKRRCRTASALGAGARRYWPEVQTRKYLLTVLPSSLPTAFDCWPLPGP